MNLRQFIDRIESKQQLVRITKPVDTVFEIATVIKKLKGRTVLFQNVKGSAMPVVSNVCSTKELVCLGLGIQKSDLIKRLMSAADNPEKPPVVSASGYRAIARDLDRIPVLTHFREDGGPYIASGIAVARDPEYGINASYHRALVKSKDELVLRVVERHLYAFHKRGLKEFVFCIGNSIPVLVASAMSVELGKSELAIANALSETPLIDVEGHAVPQSEILMLCEFTGELADEGPFFDLTQTFDIVRKQPVVRVKEIFAREDSIYHALLPGDREHKILMGMPREPTIFREVSKVCECLDVHITPGGCCWLHGAVKIRKRNEDDAKKAIEAAFRGHPSMKHVFIVDHDIDIEDPAQLEWALATRFQGDRDLVIMPKEKGSSLDPSSDLAIKETTKVGFDLTIPDPSRANRFKRAQFPLKIELDDYL
jgi:2,5-furandicarboxylate decarboxylase 1